MVNHPIYENDFVRHYGIKNAKVNYQLSPEELTS